MATTQYIGSRYVPIFADPIQWSNRKEYEPLTIVLHNGHSYTSKQYVPIGIDIENEDFWVITGDYNAQVNQYRNEVAQLEAEWPRYKNATDASLAAWKQTTETSLENWKTETVDDFTEAISNLPERVDNIEDVLQTHVLCIGDSFGDTTDQGADNVWTVEIAKRLGLQLLNYCAGGAGYVRRGRGDRNFIENIERAIADTSYDKNAVRYVFIYGGYNDAATAQNVDTFKTNVQTAINLIRTNYPKSELVIFGCNTQYRPILVDYTGGNYVKAAILVYTNMVKDVCVANGVQFCNTCGWMWGHKECYKSDGLHPNNLGRNTLVSQMLAFVNGQKLVAPAIDWQHEVESTNFSISYSTNVLTNFKITQHETNNPNKIEFSMEFEVKAPFGTNTHTAVGIAVMTYARLLPPDCMVPVYYWDNANGGIWAEYGYVYRDGNYIAMKKISLEATPVGTKLRTGLIPFEWDYTEYTFE